MGVGGWVLSVRKRNPIATGSLNRRKGVHRSIFGTATGSGGKGRFGGKHRDSRIRPQEEKQAPYWGQPAADTSRNRKGDAPEGPELPVQTKRSRGVGHQQMCRGTEVCRVLTTEGSLKKAPTSYSQTSPDKMWSRKAN